jgi:hypothetical protein
MKKITEQTLNRWMANSSHDLYQTRKRKPFPGKASTRIFLFYVDEGDDGTGRFVWKYQGKPSRVIKNYVDRLLQTRGISHETWSVCYGEYDAGGLISMYTNRALGGETFNYDVTLWSSYHPNMWNEGRLAWLLYPYALDSNKAYQMVPTNASR